MCYEFESWSWKARAAQLYKAQVKRGAAEQKSAPGKPAKETQRARPEGKEPEKIPV
jgi:hypothetical protein